jgi:hypothetical protein
MLRAKKHGMVLGIAVFGLILFSFACGGDEAVVIDKDKPEWEYTSEGYAKTTFPISTIEPCQYCTAQLRNDYCAFFKECEQLCGSLGYWELGTATAKGCKSVFKVDCICLCKEPPSGPCGTP